MVESSVHHTNLKSRIIFWGIILGISFLIAALLAEIYIRKLPRHEYITPEILRKRSLQYEPAIFARHVFPQEAMKAHGMKNGEETCFYEINKHGYRGREFSVEKPAGTIRIMIYGGSATFDPGSTLGQDWPRLVEKHLHQKGFICAEVINAGVPGHASFDSVGRLFAEGHVFCPDYVGLYNAWNDIKYFRSDKSLLRIYKPHRELTDPRKVYQNRLDRFLCEVSQLYVRLRIRYYKYILKAGLEGRETEGSFISNTISDQALQQFKLNLETFIDVARNAGSNPFLMTQVRLVDKNNTEEQKSKIMYDYQQLNHYTLCTAFEKTDEIIRLVAGKKKVPLIDAWQHMGSREHYYRDHVHLSNKGSEELARLTAEHLAGLIGLQSVDSH